MKFLANFVKTKWIYTIVMVYLTAAFGWWAYLLLQQNNQELKNQTTFLYQSKGLESSDPAILQLPEYQLLLDEHRGNYWQIIGEGLVFILTLFLGLYLLNRSYQSVLQYRLQQKNFLLSITHELRSPLASTKLVLETIKKRELKREQQIDLVDSALMETERLNRLVNDMLLAVRMEEVYDPVFQRTNIETLFENIIKTMRIKFPKIEWDISSELIEQEVIVDRTGLTSIITNLLENAAKYSNQKGLVRVIYKEYKDKIIIKVADNGIGIPALEKKRVFERFYRVGDEAVRKSKGTGLGLYLVKKLVETYGGRIVILDNVPKGTIFDVTLPINLPES